MGCKDGLWQHFMVQLPFLVKLCQQCEKRGHADPDGLSSYLCWVGLDTRHNPLFTDVLEMGMGCMWSVLGRWLFLFRLIRVLQADEQPACRQTCCIAMWGMWGFRGALWSWLSSEPRLYARVITSINAWKPISCKLSPAARSHPFFNKQAIPNTCAQFGSARLEVTTSRDPRQTRRDTQV